MTWQACDPKSQYHKQRKNKNKNCTHGMYIFLYYLKIIILRVLFRTRNIDFRKELSEDTHFWQKIKFQKIRKKMGNQSWIINKCLIIFAKIQKNILCMRASIITYTWNLKHMWEHKIAEYLVHNFYRFYSIVSATYTKQQK